MSSGSKRGKRTGAKRKKRNQSEESRVIGGTVPLPAPTVLPPPDTTVPAVNQKKRSGARPGGWVSSEHEDFVGIGAGGVASGSSSTSVTGSVRQGGRSPSTSRKKRSRRTRSRRKKAKPSESSAAATPDTTAPRLPSPTEAPPRYVPPRNVRSGEEHTRPEVPIRDKQSLEEDIEEMFRSHPLWNGTRPPSTLRNRRSSLPRISERLSEQLPERAPERASGKKDMRPNSAQQPRSAQSRGRVPHGSPGSNLPRLPTVVQGDRDRRRAGQLSQGGLPPIPSRRPTSATFATGGWGRRLPAPSASSSASSSLLPSAATNRTNQQHQALAKGSRHRAAAAAAQGLLSPLLVRVHGIPEPLAALPSLPPEIRLAEVRAMLYARATRDHRLPRQFRFLRPVHPSRASESSSVVGGEEEEEGGMPGEDPHAPVERWAEVERTLGESIGWVWPGEEGVGRRRKKIQGGVPDAWVLTVQLVTAAEAKQSVFNALYQEDHEVAAAEQHASEEEYARDETAVSLVHHNRRDAVDDTDARHVSVLNDSRAGEASFLEEESERDTRREPLSARSEGEGDEGGRETFDHSPSRGGKQAAVNGVATGEDAHPPLEDRSSLAVSATDGEEDEEIRGDRDGERNTEEGQQQEDGRNEGPSHSGGASLRGSETPGRDEHPAPKENGGGEPVLAEGADGQPAPKEDNNVALAAAEEEAEDRTAPKEDTDGSPAPKEDGDDQSAPKKVADDQPASSSSEEDEAQSDAALKIPTLDPDALAQSRPKHRLSDMNGTTGPMLASASHEHPPTPSPWREDGIHFPVPTPTTPTKNAPNMFPDMPPERSGPMVFLPGWGWVPFFPGTAPSSLATNAPRFGSPPHRAPAPIRGGEAHATSPRQVAGMTPPTKEKKDGSSPPNDADRRAEQARNDGDESLTPVEVDAPAGGVPYAAEEEEPGEQEKIRDGNESVSANMVEHEPAGSDQGPDDEGDHSDNDSIVPLVSTRDTARDHVAGYPSGRLTQESDIASGWAVLSDADMSESASHTIGQPAVDALALHMASWSGDAFRVGHLLRAGMNPLGRDGRGRTPLHYACESGALEVVQELMDAGADEGEDWTDASGDTALHLAVLRNHDAVVHFLLESAVDARQKDQMGRLPLDVAREMGHKTLLDVLTEYTKYAGRHTRRSSMVSLGTPTRRAKSPARDSPLRKSESPGRGAEATSPAYDGVESKRPMSAPRSVRVGTPAERHPSPHSSSPLRREFVRRRSHPQNAMRFAFGQESPPRAGSPGFQEQAEGDAGISSEQSAEGYQIQI